MRESDEVNDYDQEPQSDHMVTASTKGKGYLTGPGIHEMPVDYAIEDGHAYCEGCIELGPVVEVKAEAERIERRRSEDLSSGGTATDVVEPDDESQRGVGISPQSSFLWTNGVLVYTVALNVPNKSRIDEAIQHIESLTAIRFVKRTSANANQFPNYVEIVSNGDKGWSSSQIGMRGGRQLLRFSDRHSWKILVHEFGHALGLYHEQSRSDRDQYVQIKWSNIPDGPPPVGESDWTGNFKMKSSAVDYQEYDYDSIMHYGAKSFARDRSKPTIVPLQPGATIGQREGLSYGDRLAIATMYQRYFNRGYAGVWRAGTGRYGLWVNASWSSFVSKWREWSEQGLRLQDIHVRRVGSKTLYSGIFTPGSGRHALWANVSWTSFKDKWQQWSQDGMRLVDIHVHRVNGQNRYSGVFQGGSGSYALWVNSSWSRFKERWQEMNEQNLRLHDIHVHHVNGKNRYTGVFLPGSGAYALWASASWTSFVSKWKKWSGEGLRLVDLNMHKVNGSVRYTGAFVAGVDSHYLWANVTYESFKAKWQQLAQQNLRLVDFEFVNSGGDNADSADFALADSPTPPGEDSIKAFGGLFDPDNNPDTEESPVSSNTELTDGGGAVLEVTATAQSNTLDQSDGGAYFSSANSNDYEDSGDGDRGVGGAVFEPADTQIANGQDIDASGVGGAVSSPGTSV